MKGFSPRNLKYMRAFAQAWPTKNLCNRLLHKFLGPQVRLIIEKTGARRTMVRPCNIRARLEPHVSFIRLRVDS